MRFLPLQFDGSRIAKGWKTSSGDKTLAAKGQSSERNGQRGEGKPRKIQGLDCSGDRDQINSSQSSTPPSNNQSRATTMWRCHTFQKTTTHRSRGRADRNYCEDGEKGHEQFDYPKHGEGVVLAVG